jgi:predicted aconitase
MTLQLTNEEQAWLSGDQGLAIKKAMQILVALGKIYDADRMIPVASAQIAGVSYDNLGEAGLEFLEFMANEGGSVQVMATLNPAGMDIDNWQELKIPVDFASNQMRVIKAYEKMGIISSCTCTPYLSGNLPLFGEHIAWSESSAVCFANSVLGARTNREGGPSALAAALVGRTPNYGYHLDKVRIPDLTFQLETNLKGLSKKPTTHLFGALGKIIGDHIQKEDSKCVPYIRNLAEANLEDLKSFSASLATFGGSALFHMENITPEAKDFEPPRRTISISQADLDHALRSLSDIDAKKVDFVSVGCPHYSINEIGLLASRLLGKHVQKEFWITTSKNIKQLADKIGFTRIIEASGARLISDTCCVVAPIQGRFKAMITDSAKACYYGHSKNQFKTCITSIDEIIKIALNEEISQ